MEAANALLPSITTNTVGITQGTHIDLPTTTSSSSVLLVNNGAGVDQGQGSIAVDGVDATTKFSVNAHVYKADGTDVGVITAVTPTLLTFGAYTLAAVANDDDLHSNAGVFQIDIGECCVHVVGCTQAVSFCGWVRCPLTATAIRSA